MGELVEINQKRNFTLAEAKQLLPVIQRITKGAHEEVMQLTTQLSWTENPERKAELEERVQALFEQWQRKVRKLGCEAKGMWLVDFDSGDGYYCWHFPESEVGYFHGYAEGFRGRKKVH